MRSLDEILEVVNHPTQFLKSDFYKAAFIEIYSFVPLEKLPEAFVKHLPEEAKKDWNNDLTPSDDSLFEDIAEEIKYLRKMLDEHLINEAAARTPRVLALLWVTGADISSYDAKLLKMLATRESDRDLKRKLSQLYIKLERKYILK